MNYCNAGHCLPLVCNRAGEIVELKKKNPAAGFGIDVTFRDDTYRLRPGDRLVLYTDGVVETFSGSLEMFGEERLYAVIRRCAAMGPQEFVDELKKAVIDFALEYPAMARALVVVSPALSGFTFAGELPKQAGELEVAEEAGDIELIDELLQFWVDGPHRSPDQVDVQVRELVREMNLIALNTPCSSDLVHRPAPAGKPPRNSDTTCSVPRSPDRVDRRESPSKPLQKAPFELETFWEEHHRRITEKDLRRSSHHRHGI